jgi:hypothetical protein
VTPSLIKRYLYIFLIFVTLQYSEQGTGTLALLREAVLPGCPTGYLNSSLLKKNPVIL